VCRLTSSRRASRQEGQQAGRIATIDAGDFVPARLRPLLSVALLALR
jgi:hypothetical protein